MSASVLGDVSSSPRDILWTESKRYSYAQEEVTIRDFFQDERDDFFVDIRYSHPKKNSNT